MISEERLREEFKNTFKWLKKREEENKKGLYRAYDCIAKNLDKEKLFADSLTHLNINTLCAVYSHNAVKQMLENMYELIFEEEYVEEETDTDAE